VDDIVVVEIVDGIEDLSNGLGGIFLGELSFLTDPVKQFSAGRQLGDNVVFILPESASAQHSPNVG
jgi:hypothetical protein